MKNIPDIKIGIVAGTTDWLPSELAVENRKFLVDKYRKIYGEENIYECSIVITDNEINIKRAMKELNKAECDAVVLYWANYGPESAGTLFASEFDGPIMMFAAAEEGNEPYRKDRRDALSGFINACYALKLRQTNVYIPDRPCGTYDQCSRMIHKFFSIARTLIAMKDLKLITIGPRPSSYLAASAPSHLLYDLGIEISEYSELELFDSYKKHSEDKRIEKIVEEMKCELNTIKTSDVLPALAQYELTVDDWIRNHKGNRKYVTMTSTCWPAFPVNFGFVPCYVNSRFTAKGYPIACEVDEYGAVSEFIGQCVSNDIVTILNINNNIPDELYEKKIRDKEFAGKKYELEDLFLGYHCGVTPVCKLKKSVLDYHFVNHQLIGEEQSKGTVQGTIIPGNVTIFRIQGMRDNKLRAYVCQGQILPVEEETYGGQAIIAVPEMNRFIRNVVIQKQYPNHCAVVFGHYGEEIVAVLHQLGINEIDYNHPKSIPYENENMFSSII
ncbi:MAG: fucose isomerase [Lachnospiraceae bacterium]|nr:fucose isomerase [Lachnospiraceae bacterium]